MIKGITGSLFVDHTVTLLTQLCIFPLAQLHDPRASKKKMRLALQSYFLWLAPKVEPHDNIKRYLLFTVSLHH